MPPPLQTGATSLYRPKGHPRSIGKVMRTSIGVFDSQSDREKHTTQGRHPLGGVGNAAVRRVSEARQLLGVEYGKRCRRGRNAPLPSMEGVRFRPKRTPSGVGGGTLSARTGAAAPRPARAERPPARANGTCSPAALQAGGRCRLDLDVGSEASPLGVRPCPAGAGVGAFRGPPYVR